MLVLKPSLESRIKELARSSHTKELVGIIDGVGNLFLLSNKSNNPLNSFEIDKSEILELFTSGVARDPSGTTLWHTHPSGLVGPSRIDVQQKTVFPYHLVVTLLEDQEVLTWY